MTPSINQTIYQKGTIMGFLDKFKNKAGDIASSQDDKIESGIDKVSDKVNDATDGKYEDKINSASDKAKDAAEKFGDDQD